VGKAYLGVLVLRPAQAAFSRFANQEISDPNYRQGFRESAKNFTYIVHLAILKNEKNNVYNIYKAILKKNTKSLLYHKLVLIFVFGLTVSSLGKTPTYFALPMTASIPLTIHLQIASASSSLPTLQDFIAWSGAALAHVHHYCPGRLMVRESEPEITIRLVDEQESATLNNAWRHKKGATNILSFPAELPPDVPLALLGDLVICAPLVSQQAIEQQKQPRAHWAHLTIHGTLHLLGYDHLQPQEAEIMEALEITILNRLDFPNPYQLIEIPNV